jgi:hypothetical protein
MSLKVIKPMIIFSLVVVCSPASTAFAQSDEEKPLSGYNVLIVEKVVVEQTPATAKFPASYGIALHQKILNELRKKMIFPQIIDATTMKDTRISKDKTEDQTEDDDETSTSESDSQTGENQLILTTTIIEFKPGSKVVRATVGLGAGATVIKARFVIRIAGTDDELLILTQTGKFPGISDLFDPNKNRALEEAAGKVVAGLIKIIKKTR